MIEKHSLDVLKSAVIIARSSAMKGNDGDKVRVSVLFPYWREGKHNIGEIYNANGQTWECYQAYDNAVYPDINPNNAAWHTFNRPLHGNTPDTARAFVPVMGAHDMYRKGEYAIYDGVIYECITDTAYSPATYSGAWSRYE